MFKKIMLLILCLLPIYAYASPEQAILDIQKALDESNSQLFKERVNTPNILEHMGAVFTNLYTDPKYKAKFPGSVSMLYPVLTEANLLPLKQLLMAETEDFLYYAIDNGLLNGKGNEKKLSPKSSMLSPLMGNLSTKKKEIFDIGKAKPVNKDKSAYSIKFKLRDYDNMQVYNIDAILLENNKTWRIEDIANLEQIVLDML